MRFLILGGTRFLGRALVDAALARGNEATLFNRRQSNPNLYPELERLVGNRDRGLEALQGRCWDRVIDTCGFFPRLVRDSARLLAGSVEHYTFISSLSVYADLALVGMDESGPLATMEDGTVEEITGETYGPLKVLCEQAVSEAMSNNSQEARALNVRAGLIVGPNDLSDRFTYWPHRLGRGGDVVAPGDPQAPVQFIDVRDLAEWIITASISKLTGPYNLSGPDYTLTMGRVVDSCRQVTESDATVIWVTDEFLSEHEVAAYTEMPLWVSAELTGFSTFDCRKAIDSGVTFRPLEETVADTYRWQATRPDAYEWRGGLSAARETELLKLWRGQ